MKTTRDKVNELLKEAGCTAVLYESEQLANTLADTMDRNTVTAMVIEPTSGTITASGNGAKVRFHPWRIEVLRSVRAEEPAEKNIIILSALLEICRMFVSLSGRDGYFGKIGNVTFTKVQETRYDVNAIGWAMTLDLSPINNLNNC